MSRPFVRILQKLCYTSSHDNKQYLAYQILPNGDDKSVQEMLKDDPEALTLFNQLYNDKK